MKKKIYNILSTFGKMIYVLSYPQYILLEETLMIFKLVFYRIYEVDAQIDHPVSG